MKPTQPILPLESVNVTAAGPDSPARRRASAAARTSTRAATTPLTAAPATELRGIHAPFFTDVFFPPQPWTSNYFDALGGSGNTQLHVTPSSTAPSRRR